MPFNSNYRHGNKLQAHITDAPAPSAVVHKVIHSLPIAVLLLLTPIYLAFNLLKSIVAYFTVGPIKKSWTLLVTILHSVLKSMFEMNPPQGRHSFWLIKYASTLKLPNWFFRGSYFEKQVLIENSLSLHDGVCKSLGIDKESLKYVDENRKARRILKGEWIPNSQVDADTVILYLHGGAHYFLTPSSHRTITTKISKLSNSHVFVPEYGLAPEHPFPFAIEDALAAYLALTQNESNNQFKVSFRNDEISRVPASKVFLMGDSSGGCLALQLAQVLRSMSLPMPAGIILMSPFVDHTISGNSWTENYHSDFLSLDLVGTKWAMDVYANGIPLFHSAISPINASLHDMPPILLQCGDSEVVTTDSLELYKRGSQQTRIDLEIYQDMFHVFQAFPFIQQAAHALERTSIFMAEILKEVDTESITSEETAVEMFPSSITIIDGNNQRTNAAPNYFKTL